MVVLVTILANLSTMVHAKAIEIVLAYAEVTGTGTVKLCGEEGCDPCGMRGGAILAIGCAEVNTVNSFRFVGCKSRN